MTHRKGEKGEVVDLPQRDTLLEPETRSRSLARIHDWPVSPWAP